MNRDKLIDKLDKLAFKCEKDNIQVAAILYSVIAALYTDNEKLLADEVQLATRTLIYPDLLHAVQKAEYEAKVNVETMKAVDFVNKLLRELNMN